MEALRSSVVDAWWLEAMAMRNGSRTNAGPSRRGKVATTSQR